MKLYLNWDSLHLIQRHLDAGIEPTNLYIRWDDMGEIFVGTEGLDEATFRRLATLLQALTDEGREVTKYGLSNH